MDAHDTLLFVGNVRYGNIIDRDFAVIKGFICHYMTKTHETGFLSFQMIQLEFSFGSFFSGSVRFFSVRFGFAIFKFR